MSVTVPSRANSFGLIVPDCVKNVRYITNSICLASDGQCGVPIVEKTIYSQKWKITLPGSDDKFHDSSCVLAKFTALSNCRQQDDYKSMDLFFSILLENEVDNEH